MSVEEQIREIEEELKKTPYNKATQKHIGKQKAKLAKFRAEQAKQSAGKGGLGYGIRKRGDATVLLVGLPSVGKSTLLNQLTSADSRVAEYEFTTLKVVPGMLEYRGAKIQVLDVPGLIEGAASGKGRGKEVISVIRIADLVVFLADARKPEQAEMMKNELHQAGLRLDQSPPDIKVKRRDRGGLQITMPKKMGVDKEVIISVLNEFGVYNAEITIREKATLDQIVDAMARNLKYVPSLVVYNKADLVDWDERKGLDISAKDGKGIDTFKEAVWGKLNLMRVYLKRIGRSADMKEPMIVKRDSTVKDVGEKIHRVFVEHFKHARIWGPSAQFEGQIVGMNFRLRDGDIVEFHMD